MTETPVADTAQARRIEYMALDDVPRARRNPKEHDDEGIRRAIRRFGFTAPAILDERTGRLVAGHGRLNALIALRDEGAAPPDGVLVEGGRWLLQVVRGWSSRTDAEAEVMLVADNRLTETGGWDDRGLAEILGELNIEALLDFTGFDTGDLDRLHADLAAQTALPEPTADIDDAPQPVESDTVSVPGDLWLLGEHRLLAGDATDRAAVDRLMGADRAHCMWTDPPYGVEYVGKTKDALTIENDNVRDLDQLLDGAFAVATAVLRGGAPVYIAHSPGPLSMEFGRRIQAAGWSLRQQLVWVKDNFVLGHSDYHYRHEPIWMAYTRSGRGRLGRGGPAWHGDDAQTSVFDVPRPKRSAEHPTMKPVDLIKSMLANSCPPGGLVYDPFAGSGSTLAAAHLLGMRARCVELNPRYADVICRRFQQLTGIVPVRESDGAQISFETPPKEQQS